MKTSPDRITAALAVAALVVPVALPAQGHPPHPPRGDDARPAPGMMEGGMMGHDSGMMPGHPGMGTMQPGPRMLLHQREALGLSDAQVEELEVLRDRAGELRSSHRSEMAPVREELRTLRTSIDPDLERLASVLRRQADLHVRMLVEAAELRRDALDVLTDEQRSNVRYGVKLMRSMRSMHRGQGTPGGMGEEDG